MSLVPFTFDSKSLRVITDDETGEPLFVGRDICVALGYANPNKAMGDHCRGVTKRYPIPDVIGRMQPVRVLREGDVMRLIVGSTLPSAEAFERLVFDENLPTIRRTGSYQVGESSSTLALPRTLPEAMRLINAQAEELAALAKPAALYAELSTSSTDILISEAAMVLKIKQRDLFNKLSRDLGWIYRRGDRWLPNSKSLASGLVARRRHTYHVKGADKPKHSYQTVLTERGLATVLFECSTGNGCVK